MWAFLILAGLCAAPPPGAGALYAFELEGTPVGTVLLSLEASRFSYRSRQLFSRGEKSVTRSAVLQLDERRRIRGSGRVPESLWLWRRPPPGCVGGKDELTGREGELCADEVAGGKVTGTVFGERFEAEYRGDGELEELRLGHGRFVRIERADEVASPPDLFGEGFGIEGGQGVMVLAGDRGPSSRAGRGAQGARDSALALAREVHDSFSGNPGPGGRCLAYAQRFVARARERGQVAAVVIGLLEDGGRAYPHAWVRVAVAGGAAIEVDPSSLEPVSPRTHLALERGGSDLLDLLSGRARVTRRLLPPWDGGEDGR
ncbi:MAG: transglutaminase domain-containing protein [Myxococcaceae bacterium]